MVETTDIAALRGRLVRLNRTYGLISSPATMEQANTDAHMFIKAGGINHILAALDQLEAELSALKDGLPVGEIVAWSGTNRDMGITREVDFRFLRFDVKPGTKLYAIEPAPAAKSDLLTRAQALAVETRALASRIQAGE